MKRAFVVAFTEIALGVWLIFAPSCVAVSAATGAAAGISLVDEQGGVRTITAADIAKLPRTKATVTGHDQQSAEYEGVQLAELLQAQGVVLGKELRGPRIASYVLFEAEDDYRVVLAIAEVDPATTSKIVLLADKKNGQRLPEKEGPFRLVIPDDKRPVRWIRMLKRMEIKSAIPDRQK